MVQSKQKEIKEFVTKEEADKLQKKIAKLEKELEKSAQIKKENIMEEDDDNLDIVIPSDKHIKVMSLTPYLLTLTTEEHGRGKRFDFHGFGEVKNIPYHYLYDIIEVHPNFVDEGYFVILNKDVVRKHDLEGKYQNFITKEKWDQILSGKNQSDAANLFRACGDAQRGFMINMIHEKMLAGESVDLNLLDRLSRIVDPNGEYSIAKIGQDMIKNQQLKMGK
jgi:hypothetical protein